MVDESKRTSLMASQPTPPEIRPYYRLVSLNNAENLTHISGGQLVESH